MAQSKTKIKPPVKRQKPMLPPAEEQASQNLHKHNTGAIVQLKFDLDQEFKKELKLYAAEHDMTMKELLERSFNYYKEAHP